MQKPNLQLAQFASIAAVAMAPQGDFKVDIEKVLVGVQVRKKFRNLEELAASIRDIGVAEPLIVSANPDGTYHLIAGERRLRASKLAGLKQVPVVVRQGMDALLTRKLQVAENNEREDLTPYEEALGVIEDVDQYGVKGAADIWKRSEAWISKRTSVQKYGTITKAVLEKELSGDFEVLHSLNQIEAIDTEEARRLSSLLEAGPGSLSRAEARNCLERVKLRRSQERERQRSTENDKARSQKDLDAANAPDLKQDPAKQKNKAPPPAAAAPSKRAATASRTADGNDSETSWSIEADSELSDLRRQLLETGLTAGSAASTITASLQANGAEVDAGEWVLWNGFRDALLPLAAVLGEKRTEQYLKRLSLEIKRKDPRLLLEEMHGDSYDSPAAAALPSMPDGWRF
jgi:ParB family chromosome partitioning protein